MLVSVLKGKTIAVSPRKLATLLITGGDPTIHSRFGVEFAPMESHVDGLARDFLYALRNLRKNRRFSLVAIFALALGIGATTVMFSVIYGVVIDGRSEEHTSELQSLTNLVCRLLLEKKKNYGEVLVRDLV